MGCAPLILRLHSAKISKTHNFFLLSSQPTNASALNPIPVPPRRPPDSAPLKIGTNRFTMTSPAAFPSGKNPYICLSGNSLNSSPKPLEPRMAWRIASLRGHLSWDRDIYPIRISPMRSQWHRKPARRTITKRKKDPHPTPHPGIETNACAPGRQ